MIAQHLRVVLFTQGKNKYPIRQKKLSFLLSIYCKMPNIILNIPLKGMTADHLNELLDETADLWLNGKIIEMIVDVLRIRIVLTATAQNIAIYLKLKYW